MSEPTTPATPRKHRTWPRRAAALGLLLLAFGGVGLWWVLREPPLTAEEEPFIGFWTSPPRDKPIDRRTNPVVARAVEYRADRTFHWHQHDARTGATYVEYMGRWRVEDGHLIEVFISPYQINSLLSGDLRQSQPFNWHITWDGPDRYRQDRVDLPQGVTWPTFISIRCPAPEYP